MKKALFLVLLLIIALLAVSCKDKSGIDSPMGGWDTLYPEEESEDSKETFVAGFSVDDCRVQYIRTDGYRENVKFPYTVSISNEAELLNYIENNSEHYSLGSRKDPSSDSTVGFADAIEGYDSEFFEENMLVMAVLEEGSGSNRHSLVDITPENEILIKRIVPECGTCDMAEWHIIIEIPRERAEGQTFKAKYYGEDNREFASAANNYAIISLRVPEGWAYEDIPYSEENGYFGIKLYPIGNSDIAVLIRCFDYPLGYCGTGMISEKGRIGNYSFTKMRWSQNGEWTEYVFNDLFGNYYLTLEGSFKKGKYSQIIEEIIASLTLSGLEFIGESTAIKLAKEACTVEYDTCHAKADMQKGLWIVHFGKSDTAGGDQTVYLYANGKLHHIEYGE